MDIFKFKGKKILLAAAAAAGGCVIMVIFPDITMTSARKGISMWMTDVLPALLPFFICANFLQNIGIMRYLKSGVFPFVMSVLSGYPMGAKIIGDLRRRGEISLSEAKRLVSFCSTSGPAFMMGAVGVGMLGSAVGGAVIAAAHYIGAAVNGILYSRVLGRGEKDHEKREVIAVSGVQESFTEAIISSFKSLGIILAYIVIFTFVTDMIHMCGGLSFTDSQEIRALIKGFFEMTVGCGAVAECTDAGIGVKCVLCSAIMSWGGLSVIGQSASMLSGSGVSMGYILLSKFTHCVFSAVSAFIIAIVML